MLDVSCIINQAVKSTLSASQHVELAAHVSLSLLNSDTRQGQFIRLCVVPATHGSIVICRPFAAANSSA